MMRTVISFAAIAAMLRPRVGLGPRAASAIAQAQSDARALRLDAPTAATTSGPAGTSNEKTLTKDNVKNLKLLWKLQTDNQVRALHSLMPVLVVGQLNTPAGAKQVGFVAGISDNLYAFDVETGKILWQKHWDYPAPAGRGGGGGGGGASRRIRRTSASSGPAAAATRRSSVRRTRRAAGRSTS